MNESLEGLETKVSEYKCDKCRDMTFIIDEGVAIPCACRQVRIAEDILIKSGISEEFRKKRFSNFVYDIEKQIICAYKEACNYSRNFKDIEKDRCNSIMFIGQVGCGKTHLSLAIANELMDDGVGVVYMSYREVVTKLKQNIMDEAYYNRVMNRYKNARVLLIDDLFKGSISDSDVNIIFEIVNHRYFNNLPLIVSSEKSVEELIGIDEAIGSRLIEMSKNYLVKISGKKLNFRIYGK
ncbi:DnaA ATPase domain-containing protein [Romboutsia sp. 1001216sp1]|uniref:DnaA ATPase domain-containing protein n=1 Tax=Romboutsia sp. 1001216sp1 TaxID=2986997 RepID=UPI00232C5B12|nr:ATP-binding protein [Romboutsia sp. 1001216sp1]MDB8804790.1 ATP-binding protein [Romboutsia sp. 1001216sp1]MDB8808105.1 ATP-binding protein [Romboutsia sp. 1001216sp1]MDB8810436.1 ATP-binding protein [Romboutsia sp. 1001216sp1]MDB8816155.1 ATP-binding protein [Romboutsia sp. 1001216sp1]MDB8818891.1 ATP-binding protein [Romboutsia sp. 1001216sp1]